MTIRELPSDLQEVARKELNEDPARIAGDLQHLKEWIAKQPHLNARTDDQWLVTFLRGCKYSLEKTKAKLDLFYTVRTTVPELTLDVKLSHPKIMQLFDTLPIVLPKTAGPGQPRVFIMRPADQDLTQFTIFEIMCVSYLFQQVLLMEDDTAVVAGIRSVLDLEGATMAHFTVMTPTVMKKMVTIGQDAAPIRMKGLHYLNTPPGFETVFGIMKTFLNEKNRSRHLCCIVIDSPVKENTVKKSTPKPIQIHNKNYEEMYKSIPKEILPTEYGGQAGSIAEIREYWKKKVLARAGFLEEELQYKTDESKRPGKPKTTEEMFGVEGSFRQLQLD